MSFCYRDNGYVPQALWNYAYNFDGSTNYIKKTSNLSSVSDSTNGFISFFLYYSSAAGPTIYYASSSGNQIISIGLTAANPAQITCSLSDANGANTWGFKSTSTITINTYYHIMINWDTAHASGSKVANIYANDTSLGVTTTSDAMGNTSVGWSTATGWAVGADTSGATKYNGCLAQLAFYPGQTLDITNSSNRRLFSNSSFHPIFIGRQGEVPTGTAAKVYLTSSAAGIGTNSGTGGAFDSVNGTFTDCAAGTP